MPESASQRPRGGILRGLIHGALALVLLGGGAFSAYWLMERDTSVGERQPQEQAARLVTVTPAETSSPTVSLTAWGRVQPRRELELRPRVSGRVTDVADSLEPGAVVAEDETLLQLDQEPFNIDLRRARTELTRAQADLVLEQGEQTIAEREFELLEEPASEAERALMLRQPQLNQAQAAVTAAEADVADARRALGDTEVTAPFAALVRARNVATGAQVDSGTSVASLVGIGTWWVELAVPARHLQWLEFPDGDGRGSTVRLGNEGAWSPGQYRQGRVVRLLGDLQENGRMARVLVAVDDPLARESSGPRLLLGSFLRGSIRGRQVKDAVALEPDWVRPGDTLWVMDDEDELVIRDLDVVYRDDDRVLASGGIEPGERVVTSPLALPTQGMPLRTANEDRDGSDGS